MLELNRIGMMRKSLGLTQKHLADMAGVSQSLIAKIESGKIDPAYSKVVQIAAALERIGSKGKKTLDEIMSKNIVSVKPSDYLDKAIRLMREKDISQLPVLEDGICIGSVSDSMVVELVSKRGGKLKSLKVEDVMGESFPILPPNAVVDVATELLSHYTALLVRKNGRLIGIVTKADLLRAI